MFSLKTLTSFLAVAGSLSIAFPTSPVASVEVVKRGITFPPYELVARSPFTGDVERTTPPKSIPDAVDLCKTTLKPILVDLDAAIVARVKLDVLVPLWVKISVAIKDLAVNIVALANVDVDILGGLKADACAKVFLDLLLDVALKLKASVALLGLVDVLLFANVFADATLPIIASIEAIVKVSPTLKAFLDIKAVVDILLPLSLSLGVAVDLVTRLNGLLLL